MVCDQKVCANDVPPSFVVDQNCETTAITFTAAELYKVDRPFFKERVVTVTEREVRRYSRSRSPVRDYRSPVSQPRNSNHAAVRNNKKTWKR